MKKRCKLYKVGQGLITVIETVGSAGDAYGGGGAASAPKTGPRQAIYDGLTYQNTDAELISLEEADDETSAAKAVVGDDDIDVEDDPVSDDTFLEEDEDENDDVTDLIGDGIEDDEEP